MAVFPSLPFTGISEVFLFGGCSSSSVHASGLCAVGAVSRSIAFGPACGVRTARSPAGPTPQLIKDWGGFSASLTGEAWSAQRHYVAGTILPSNSSLLRAFLSILHCTMQRHSLLVSVMHLLLFCAPESTVFSPRTLISSKVGKDPTKPEAISTVSL